MANLIETRNFALENLKKAKAVRIKTRQELLSSGWCVTKYSDSYQYEKNGALFLITKPMAKSLGQLLKVQHFDEVDMAYNLEGYRCNFYPEMLSALAVEEEMGDYIDFHESAPVRYCGVEDLAYAKTILKLADGNINVTKNKKANEKAPFDWKDMETYLKGYQEGFDRALQLMKDQTKVGEQGE